ncbi:MAG: MFS transporter [Myxococcales bacterium]|nr:MFS transporter [Myxococcales bacterium]HIK85923.1 MFS transporter [Myxococcales bacterium]
MDRRTRGVIAAAFIAQGLAVGSTLAVFSLFIRPVAETFGASTLEVSIGISLIMLSLATCGVPIGIWLDRGTPKYVMFTGCTLMTTTILLASIAQSLGALAALCVISGIAIPMLGPLTTAAVVGKVASTQRGRALGIANLGIPVFGIGFAFAAGFAIEASGWRTTLQLFASVIFILGFPAIAFGIPTDLNESSRSEAKQVAPADHWTPIRLLASWEFRLIALILGIGMGTTTGWVAHVAPYLNDLGASMRFSGGILGMMQGAMMVGTLVLGTMADRRSPVRILLGVFGVQIACFGVLFSDFGLIAASAALLVAGVATGGLLPVLSHLFAEQFGTANLGRSMGLANLAILPFGFSLPMLAGWLRDTTGSYSTTTLLCMALVLVGAFAVTALSATLRRASRVTTAPSLS